MPRTFDPKLGCQICGIRASDSDNYLMKCSLCGLRWHHLCHRPPLTAAEVNELNKAANRLRELTLRERRPARAEEKRGTAYGWKCSNCSAPIDLTLSDDDEPATKTEPARDVKLPATAPARPEPAVRSSVTACGAGNLMASSDLKGKGKAVDRSSPPTPTTSNQAAQPSQASASTSSSAPPQSLQQLKFGVESMQLGEPSSSSLASGSSVRPIARLPSRALPRPFEPSERPVIEILEANRALLADRGAREVIELSDDASDDDEEDEDGDEDEEEEEEEREEEVKKEEAGERLIAPLPRSRVHGLASEADIGRGPTPLRTTSGTSGSTPSKAARKSSTPQPPSAPSTSTASTRPASQLPPVPENTVPSPPRTEKLDILPLYKPTLLPLLPQDSEDDALFSPLPTAPPSARKPAWLNRTWPPHPLLRGLPPPKDWNEPPKGGKVPRKGKKARQLIVKPERECLRLPPGRREFEGERVRCGVVVVLREWPLRDWGGGGFSPEL